MFNSRTASNTWNNSVFNIDPKRRLYTSVPPLMIGFDTETTGFTDPEPISYGIVTYRNGVQHGIPEHFIADPLENNGARHASRGLLIQPYGRRNIEPDAEKTHGWSKEAINLSAFGDMRPIDDRYEAPELLHPEEFSKLTMPDVVKRYYPPATHPRVAVNRAVARLAHHVKQGGVIVGSNPMYDLTALYTRYQKYNGADISTSGLDLGFHKDKKGVLRISPTAPVIDVIEHDRVLDPSLVKKGHPDYRSRSLTNLSAHYGVKPGGHEALDDARAAMDVYMKQVEHNVERSRM